MFESAFKSDYHTFRREFWQILLLAGPGVAISTLLSAVVILYPLDYSSSFSWAEALMLGAVLSATDPIAVVALLKEVGASKRLNTLIEGESLLNDGTAMVVFLVMLEIAKGESLGIVEIIVKFVRLSAGGPLLGLVFGIAMAYWMKRIYDDSVMERSLTFFTTYFVFYLAEGTDLHVSGILAIVALGLYMSAWGKTSIDVASEEIVHNFWNILGYMAETIVFLLSGVIIGETVLTEEIKLEDWGKLVLLFFLLLLVRGVVILFMYPLFVKSVYGFTWQQAFILVYGGLRGAVGLALALIIYGETDINKDVRFLSLFLMAGIASLTLLINATTTGFFIEKLGLAKSSRVQEDLLKQVCKTVYDETIKSINDLKRNKFLRFADWEKVYELSGLKNFMRKVLLRTSTGKQMKKTFKNRTEEALLEEYLEQTARKNIVEMENEMRHRYLTTLKGLYWHEYEKGQCGARTALVLIESADVALDQESCRMQNWEYLEKVLVSGWIIKFFKKTKNLPLIGKLFTLFLYNRLAYSYDIASTFLACHSYAQETLSEVIEEESQEALQAIMTEAEDQVQMCRDFVTDNVTEIFSEINRDIQTKKATYAVLNRQLCVVNEFSKHGLIDEKEYKLMTENIIKFIYKLQRKSMFSTMPSLEEILPKIAFFDSLPEKDLHEIIVNSKQVLIQPGEFLFKAGEKAEGVFIILRGKAVEFNEAGFSYQHEVGSIVGVHNLLAYVEFNLTSGKAETLLYSAFLSKENFPNFEENDNAYEKLWRITAPNLVKLNPRSFSLFLNTLDYDRLCQFIELCELGRYELGAVVDISSGGFLMKGTIEQVQESRNKLRKQTATERVKTDKKRTDQEVSRTKFESLCFVEPDQKGLFISLSDPAIILHLSSELYQEWRSKKQSLVSAVDTVLYRRQSTIRIKNRRDAKNLAAISKGRRSAFMGPEEEHLNRGTTQNYSKRLKNLEDTNGLKRAKSSKPQLEESKEPSSEEFDLSFPSESVNSDN